MLEKFISIIKIIYYSLLTLPRDLRGLLLMIKLEKLYAKWEKDEVSVYDLFKSQVKTNSQKACFVFEQKTWTYQDVDIYSNRVANVFSKRFNLKKGDAVALFMENRPEYMCLWLGLSRIGCITALINTNLKATALSHSINIAKSKIVIFGTELAESIEQVRSSVDVETIYVNQGPIDAPNSINLDLLFTKEMDDPFMPSERVTSKDILMYIYTSGTTGLPKPAVIKHNRYFGGAFTFHKAARLTSDDIIYVTLPVYHGNGCLIGCGMALIAGSTVVLRKKFSATSFWKDCIEHRCTAMIYVGEVCRYLVNQPESPLDKQHRVRIAVGNGLRKNVWGEFTKRFNIKPVEFYAASEGNCTIINTMGKEGACGFVPVWNLLLKVLPLNLIKIDSDMNPLRNRQGFCIQCKPGETGLVVGLIGKSVKTSYNGYANNPEASKKKIIENIFAFGQRAFNSGDLMQTDEYGWMYFSDRLGDTYRWKGENVSTIEVENILSSKLNSKEVVVYGVSVPGAEGKAGMACISVNSIDDLKELSESVKRDLAAYARPLFLRLSEQIDHTGSFKAQKSRLVEDAYDRTRINDKLYYFDLKEQFYKELTQDIYEKIQLQLIKF